MVFDSFHLQQTESLYKYNKRILSQRSSRRAVYRLPEERPTDPTQFGLVKNYILLSFPAVALTSDTIHNNC